MWAQAETERQVRVTATVANVREQPSPSAKVLFQLKRDQTAKLVETSGDWHQIEDAAGRRGYVFGTVVQVLEPPPPPPAPPEPSPPPAVTSLTIDHKEVGCIVAEQYPKLDACFVPLESVGRAEIHFRALDTEPWYAVGLEKDGPCLSGHLPKPMRSTKEIQYYVHVVDTAFTQRQQPAEAPQGAYRARVVRKESDCTGLKRLAYAVGKVGKPIVVGVARTAAGLTDAAAIKSIGSLLLAGFRPEGVILAATGAAPASATAASGGAGGGGGAAGGGAAGGGLSTTAVLGVVGAGVAVAGVAAAAGGGDGGSDGTTPPTNPPPATTPAQALAGGWTGQGNFREDFNNCDYTASFDMTLGGSGTSISGTFRGVVTGVTGPDQRFCQMAVGRAFIDGPLNGTASGGSITFTVPGPMTFNGTYSTTSMSGNFQGVSLAPFEGFRVNGTWSATKR